MPHLLPQFEFRKTMVGAVTPSKAHDTDSGFDLTLLAVVKHMGVNSKLYDTGIQVKPEEGYYFDLVARSSLQKLGYMLGNSVGIIDNGYRGNIMVCLVKFDPDAKPLELPLRAVQLIPRQVINMKAVEVTEFSDNTERGDGGFGSSDVKLEDLREVMKEI